MNVYLPPGQHFGTPHNVPVRQPALPSAKANALLVALKLPGIGPVAVRKLAGNLRYETDVAIGAPLYSSYGLLRDDDAYKRASHAAHNVVEKCSHNNINIISILDDDYPSRLRQIIDAPPIIYILGNVSAFKSIGCAVVGTRHASDYGLKIAFRISSMLAERQFSVISGLALGIDTAAHEGALAATGTTVAIMAHGLDTVAPSSNRKLAARIIEQGGALVSEHEPGVPARPAEFVRRNRIQSGMALCSIIVESGEQGGSMHQARFTRSQGRPVLAILPETKNGALQGFNHAGGNLLVSEYGATRIRNTEDLMGKVDEILEAIPFDDQASQTVFRL